MGRETRRHPRFIVDGVDGRAGLRAHVKLLDLGPGGAAIQSNRRLAVDDKYALRFELEGKSVTIEGVIVWTGRSPAGEERPPFSAGIKFTEALPLELQVLLELPDASATVDERRHAGIRFQFKVPGKAVIETTEVYKVKLISLSGMLIEAARRLERDEIYEMEILRPGGPPFAFTGGVRSCHEAVGVDRPLYEIGIEFLEMSSEAKEHLNGFVAWLATA